MRANASPTLAGVEYHRPAPTELRPRVSTERSILARVAAGDEGATRACIDEFGGLVWSLARRLCPTREMAEDAAQDAFVSLWRSAGRYDPAMGSEATFVATITRRRIIDRVRKLGRHAGVRSIEHADPSEPPNAGAFAERSEEAAVALDALRELSDEQQRVIRMSVVHGLSHQQIAEATGMPLGTVKTHLRRGLIRVRELLDERREARVAT